MLVLALDTSMAACSACVYDAASGLVLASRHEFMDRGQAEALAPMVQDTMALAGVAFKDLARIAVTMGPGTFTGVRIGLAMARGLGVALNIPITGINSLAAIACNETAGNLPILVAVDARANEIYFAAFDQSGKEITAPCIIALADAQKLMPNHRVRILGTAAELLLDKTDRQHVHSEAGDLPVAANFVKFAASIPASTVPPEPLYLRPPDVKPQATKISFSMAGPAAAKLLAELHGENFETRWSEADFSGMLAVPGTSAILVSNQNNPMGFVLFRTAADEAEILTICTRPAFRQKGHGKLLVQHLENVLKKNDGVISLFIEVAVSNHAALALYASCGFEKAGARKNYYERGDGRREDALIMRKGL